MDDDEVSRLVALAWGVAAAPQRGPKRELSHERIVESAIEIADSEGLQAVTMQRVAQGFGFTTMALYRYVASKDDLRMLMLDAVAGGDEAWAIDSDDWQAGLEQWASSFRDVYARHPWALDIPVSMEALLMPGQMRVVDAGMRAMRSLQASPSQKLAVMMALSVHVRGFAAMARDIGSTSADITSATRQLVADVALDGRMADIEPLVASGAYFGEGGAVSDGDFDLVLGILLPGIERALEGGHAEHVESTERTPAQALAAAEAELAATTALRKATQRRVSAIERDEAKARAARDSARVVAKEAAKQAARHAKEAERGRQGPSASPADELG